MIPATTITPKNPTKTNQSSLLNLGFVKAKVVHETDTNSKYIGIISTNAFTGEKVETFPNYKSNDIDQREKKKRSIYELVCGLFCVSPEPANHRPSFNEVEKRKVAHEIAGRCIADLTLNPSTIAASEYSDFTRSF